jgi:penicillin-binding protein 1C
MTPHPRLRRLARPGLVLLLTAALVWHLLPYAFPLPPALLQPRPVSPRYLARDGTPLRLLLDEAGQRSAPEVPWESLPKPLVDATLAVEDQRFFHHGGIDYLAVCRAVWTNLRAGRVVSGASTLPQQLVKISSPPSPRRSLWVKFTEAQQARRLVREWPRTRILATYLNRVSYGNLFTGCQAAAEGHFNKPLSDLTLAESALLAGLPQAPGKLNALRYPQLAKQRQAHVLQRLLDEGYIDPDTHQRALTQPLVYTPFRGGFAAPHAIDLLHATVPASAGDPVRTTLDAALQHLVEQTLAARLATLRDRHVTQAAAVILDNATGEVLALAGSRDFFSSDGGQINGAWTPHSPGSAIKPFTYLLALEHGLTPATVLADLPVAFTTPTGLYRPENYTGKTFGPVTLRAALGNSLNISAVKTLDRIGGAPVLLDCLQRLGLTTLTESAAHYGLGLTIGNAPVRLLELTNAYACLARLGDYHAWRLLADTPPTAPVRAFDARHAWQIADILSDNQARLLTFGAHSPLRMPFRVAAKTGTSSSYRDNWALGYTPEYTIAVWVGNFDRTPMQNVSGVTGAAPILADLFETVRDRFGPTTWFATPPTLQSVRIDPRTGKRLTAQSPPARLSHSEWLTPDQFPPAASAGDYDAQGRALLPPEFAKWIASRDNWLADLIIPAGSPDPQIRIVQPLPGSIYHLDPDLPGQGRQLPLRSSRDPDTTLSWTSPTLTITQSGAQWTAQLTPGEHLLRLHTATETVSAESRITVIQD